MSHRELAALLTAPTAAVALKLAVTVESVAAVVAAADIELMTRHQCRGVPVVMYEKLVSCTEKRTGSSNSTNTSADSSSGRPYSIASRGSDSSSDCCSATSSAALRGTSGSSAILLATSYWH
jgi:hypothetical protein